MRTQARRGMTLIELLVVMFIMALLMAFIATVLMNIGSEPRKKKALADIAKISLALMEYKSYFGEYPPDTGYGLRMNGTTDDNRPVITRTIGGVDVNVPTYDPGSLWRYLYRRVLDPKTGQMVGPFLEEWSQDQLIPYDDRYDAGGRSRYLSDPWGKPYGYIGNRKRVIHSPGSFDIFSAGPDGVTACNNETDDDEDGQMDPSDDPQSQSMIDNRAYNTQQVGVTWRALDDDDDGIANDSGEFGPEAIRNGDLGDDLNSWTNK